MLMLLTEEILNILGQSLPHILKSKDGLMIAGMMMLLIASVLKEILGKLHQKLTVVAHHHQAALKTS